MFGCPGTRCARTAIGFVVSWAALSASVVLAQPCAGAPGGTGVASGEKFRLIVQQCPSLAEPQRVHHAAQLDLYANGAGLAIGLPRLDAPLASNASSTTPTPAATTLPSPRAPFGSDPLPPPGRDAARVLTLAPALTAAARAHDIDPLLLHAIAHIESRHNTEAVSPAGARGVMQVMPATARRFGVGDPERSLHDADTNLRASAALLRTLRKRYGDDLRLVLAAYNAGEGAVEKYGRDVPPYPETQAYVRNVTAVYRRLSAEFSVSESGALVARGGKS